MHKPLRPEWALEVKTWLNKRGMYKSDLAKAINVGYTLLTNVLNGYRLIVNLSLGDISVKNYMLVEKCVHTFNESEHYMDLTLRGGEFVG